MPTSDFSKITVGGPCKISDNGTVIYTEGNVVITPVPKYRDIPSSLTTKDDQILVDLTYTIDYTPKSIWNSSYRGILLPTALTNFTDGGARLIGAANRTVTITGSDGELWQFTRAMLTKMPNVFFGLGKSLYGPAQHTAFLGHNKALDDQSAFVFDGNTTTPGVPGTTPGTWSQSDFPAGHQEAECQATWHGVTGFDSMFALEGFELQHELEFADVKQGNITVDKRVVGYRGMIVFKPQGPTTTNLNTYFPGKIGDRLSTGAADLTINGSNIAAQLKSCKPYRGKFNFDNKLMRHDEFAFVTALTAPGMRLVLSDTALT